MSATGPETLLLGSEADEVAELAAALGAELTLVPDPLADAVTPPGVDWGWAAPLDRWRDDVSSGAAVGRAVVAPWALDLGEPEELAETGLDGWMVRAEVQFARWFAAMGAAARRCADGGAVVAVVERPAPLDCAGWAPATCVAEAVAAMTRSLARAEGGRGVRVNAVTTPVRSTRPPVVDPAPALPAFPGSIGREVAGAVELLLRGEASGVTGTVVHADCGRSWA
jgi:NAD(P)-dependent dehydrogenase (short-subunit alcohol dehydrogenase family)